MRARSLLLIVVLFSAGALTGCHHKGSKGPYFSPAPAHTR